MSEEKYPKIMMPKCQADKILKGCTKVGKK